MKIGIFYFSATGNSLTTAKILAQELGADACIPLMRYQGAGEVTVDFDCVGFVFPIYYGDMPYLVRETIGRMCFTAENPYIFAFPTFRGHTGDAAKRLDDLLAEKGRALSLLSGIPMPGNSYLSTDEQVKDTLENQRERIRAQRERIQNREKADYRSLPAVKPSPVSVLSNMRGICADESCTGCGTCVRVCPMGNIRLENGRAVFGDRCQTCLACFHWCPAEAVYMSKEEAIARRPKYRHPEVTLRDILGQK